MGDETNIMAGQTLTADLSERDGRLWDERCHGVIDFVGALTWLDRRKAFYEVLAERLCALSSADNVNIRLLSADQGQFVLYARYGDLDPALASQFGTLSAQAGRMPNLLETGEPIVFDLAHPAQEDIAWDRGVADGYTGAVTVALRGQQGIVGAADFLFRGAGALDFVDVGWLCDLGTLTGAIVENALMTDRMLSLRMADERRSLSTEIHDNIAQVVSAISLQVENALDSLDDGDMDSLRSELELVKRASDEAQLIARSELANLRRDAGLDETASMEQYEQMIRAFCAKWGMECHIESDDESRTALLPGLVAVQLVRAVNEALVNVVRHANVSEVFVEYKVGADGLTLSIADKGLGFDPAAVDPTHLGLQIMRERLAAVGGTVSIESACGAGTCVTIKVPHLV